jgi:DNA modification methylase
MLVRGDARRLPLRDACVDCCVTSPPYWNLRDYGVRDQIGLELTPDAYVAELVAVFREVWRVLKPTGTVWLNLGDSYNSASQFNQHATGLGSANRYQEAIRGEWPGHRPLISTAKPKDLIGIPWRVAFALQADGWWLRQDIIWAKPNPMPESVGDRCTKAHEYLFLLAKQDRYYYDADAIREPQSESTFERYKPGEAIPSFNKYGGSARKNASFTSATPIAILPNGRNKRSVWTINTEPYSGFTPNYDEADYVGADGKPYRASADCLIHAPLAGRRSQQKAEGDAQLDRAALRSLDSDARRVARLIVAHASNVSRRNGVSSAEIVRAQTPESTPDYKRPAASISVDGQGVGVETLSHTSHTAVWPTHLPYMSDSLFPDNEWTASGHSTETRKTGHVPATMHACSPCAETIDDTRDTSASPDDDSVDHSDENKSEGDCVSGARVRVSERSERRTAHTDIPRCHCSIVGTDHFATMPEALIEPCVLAGCPLGGLVLDPFIGSGTVGAVAERLGRRWVGVDLAYQELARERTAQMGLLVGTA